MSTRYSNAQTDNVAEVLEILGELGASAQTFTSNNAIRLAFVVQSLHTYLSTHTIIIAAVPTSVPSQEKINLI